MTKFRAFVTLESGDVKVVKSNRQDFECGDQKFLAPRANEMRRIRRPILGDFEFALYRWNAVHALEIDGAAPDGVTPEDLKNLTGGYIPSVLRKAFQEELTRLLLIVACVMGGLGFVVGTIDLYLIYKVAHSLKLV